MCVSIEVARAARGGTETPKSFLLGEAAMGPSRPRRAPLNHNVLLTLMYAPMLSMYSSLLAQTPLAAFMSLITHDSNLDVGLATGTQGVVSLLVAIPASVLADRFGRQVCLRAAALVAVLAAAFMGVCVLHLDGLVDDTTLFYLLVASSAQWGVFMGLHAAPLEALFGDSIESGARSLLCAARAIRRRAIFRRAILLTRAPALAGTSAARRCAPSATRSARSCRSASF